MVRNEDFRTNNFLMSIVHSIQVAHEKLSDCHRANTIVDRIFEVLNPGFQSIEMRELMDIYE